MALAVFDAVTLIDRFGADFEDFYQTWRSPLNLFGKV